MERKDEQASCGCKAEAGVGGQNGPTLLTARFTAKEVAIRMWSEVITHSRYWYSELDKVKGGWRLVVCYH